MRINAFLPSQLAAYSDLFERIPDCVFILDEATCVFILDEATCVVLEMNSASERILGVPREKVIGRSLECWIEGKDFSRMLRVSIRRQNARAFDVKWSSASGRPLSLEIQASPIPLANDRRVIQVIAKDVSYRRELEQRVQALEQQAQAGGLIRRIPPHRSSAIEIIEESDLVQLFKLKSSSSTG